VDIAYSVNGVPIRLTYERWLYHHSIFLGSKTKRRGDMAIELKMNEMIQACLGLSSDLTKLPVTHIWVDYDKEADVLYLSFRKPQRAKRTVETDDDVLIRTDGDEIVGITILNASTRQKL